MRSWMGVLAITPEPGLCFPRVGSSSTGFLLEARRGIVFAIPQGGKLWVTKLLAVPVLGSCGVFPVRCFGGLISRIYHYISLLSPPAQS